MTPKTAKPIHPGPRRGFTLTELLVVIGIITLIVTLSIPAFSIITGGRSIDAAENQVSAFLGRCRQDAIALQVPRGAVLFQDPNTGRVACTEVYINPYRDPNGNTNNDIPDLLDLAPDRDELLLPIGVGCQTLLDAAPASGGNQTSLLGVVLFDSTGRLTTRSWVISYGTGKNLLTDRIQASATTPFTRSPSTPTRTGAGGTSTLYDLATVGFVLYDQPGYKDQLTAGNGPAYVRDNGVPYLINRFNGTLMRGE